MAPTLGGEARAYLGAAAAVGVVAALIVPLQPQIGLAASALLFLLPVLLVSMQGRLAPGLASAIASALALNFFVLPPRFTLIVHGYDNVVALVVFLVVAAVTSRLATALKMREAAAEAHAQASDQAAELASALAGKATLEEAEAAGLDFLDSRFGPASLIAAASVAEPRPGFGALDLAAAAWASHNGDVTGHGTGVMQAADWTFVPLARSVGGDLVAVARTLDGATRTGEELDQLKTLVLLIGQARDRLALAREHAARARLEEMDALRTTLLASLAHDFRTPLTVLKSGIAELPPAQGGELARQLQRIERMFANLLGLARIEAGAVGLSLEPVDLVDVVQSVLEDLDLPPETVVRRSVAADLPLVRADARLLRHMLANLIDNAARHGGGTIEIAAEANGDRVMLMVADHGSGIAAGQEQAIFDRFVRLAIGDRAGGSGLGLAIVRGFADAMGVEVRGANRADGPGAVFTLALPVQR